MAPGKTRGGSPYNQFDIIPGDTLGGHTGPAGDSWLPAKSPPTNKIGSKSSNASWPPGNVQTVVFLEYHLFFNCSFQVLKEIDILPHTHFHYSTQ